MHHEELQHWLDESEDVLSEYDAFRASLSPELGKIATETQVELESKRETPQRASQSAPNAHTSPSFYI